MKDKEKIAKLHKCFDDVVWMAIRYAHGRHTYAPGMVRDAIASFQEVFPEWKPKEDCTITLPDETSRLALAGDYLHDLVNP